MADDAMTISTGETDMTVEACSGGLVEIGLGDDETALYGQLDLEDVDRLIELLQQAKAGALALLQR